MSMATFMASSRPAPCLRLPAVGRAGRLPAAEGGVNLVQPRGVEREAGSEPPGLAADRLNELFAARMLEHVGDPVADALHLGLFHPARGERGRADADAAGLERGQLVEGDCVLFYCDSAL